MKSRLILIAFLLVTLTSCEKDYTIDNPRNTLEADAGAPVSEELFVGELVTLDGSHSKDRAGKPFKYVWKFLNLPTNSSSELEDETTVKPKFTPDKSGTYLVELKIYNSSFFDIDVISLSIMEIDNPPTGQTVIIDEDIEVDTHLVNIFEDKGKIDYLVTKDVHVKGTLTIDPSVTIAFEADKGLFIDSPGSIQGIGSVDGQIVFTGQNKVPGYWKGLVINSNSPLNILEKTTVEYGGSSEAGTNDLSANIVIGMTNVANLTLADSKTQYSHGYGLAVAAGGRLNLSLRNIINDNQKPALLQASQLGSLNGLVEFNDNKTNIIQVVGDRINKSSVSNWIIPQSGTGQANPKISYVVQGKIEIASEVKIDEGVEFFFEEDSEISVTPTGSLTAIGTPSNLIKFYGTDVTVDGYWKGIAIKSRNAKNELSWVEIFNAGNSNMDGFNGKTAIGVDGENNANLKMTDMIIARSGGHGLLVENGAAIDALSFVKFVENKGSAVALPANEVSKLRGAPALEFTGNGHDGVEIFGSILLHQNESVWPALNFGATYLVSGNLAIQSGLQILPGAIFKFVEDKMIGIFPNAYLEAKGTPEQRIVFTGANQLKGYWNGISIQSNSTKNIMDYTEVSYAGKTAMPAIMKIASIGLDGDYLSNLTITNSKISHGLGFGIAVEDNRATVNSDVETINEFEDLSLGNVFK